MGFLKGIGSLLAAADIVTEEVVELALLFVRVEVEVVLLLVASSPLVEVVAVLLSLVVDDDTGDSSAFVWLVAFEDTKPNGFVNEFTTLKYKKNQIGKCISNRLNLRSSNMIEYVNLCNLCFNKLTTKTKRWWWFNIIRITQIKFILKK